MPYSLHERSPHSRSKTASATQSPLHLFHRRLVIGLYRPGVVDAAVAGQRAPDALVAVDVDE